MSLAFPGSARVGLSDSSEAFSCRQGKGITNVMDWPVLRYTVLR